MDDDQLHVEALQMQNHDFWRHGLGCRGLGFRVEGLSEIRGTLFWGPYNTDPTI